MTYPFSIENGFRGFSKKILRYNRYNTQQEVYTERVKDEVEKLHNDLVETKSYGTTPITPCQSDSHFRLIPGALKYNSPSGLSAKRG